MPQIPDNGIVVTCMSKFCSTGNDQTYLCCRGTPYLNRHSSYDTHALALESAL